MYYNSICLVWMMILGALSGVSFVGAGSLMVADLSVFLEWEMVSVNSSMVVMTFLLDWISMVFLGLVLLISSVVIFYSSSYMSMEINLTRFIYLVLLFVLSMVLMIFSMNLIAILLGWDGLGLVSFCLVIYYQNVKSFNSGMLTVLSNRVGDVMLLVSIIWLFNYGGWNFLSYMEIFESDWVMKMIVGFIVLASMTKSAQIPFSAWLPAAMAAPTPVSALVHSSTLVTAGVYLMVRFSGAQLGGGMQVLMLVGGMTMLMAGISANFEFDMKKIIALSTLSQLGLMMSILCLGFKELAYFHLLTHAMFKALLFMCAGAMIHSFQDSQDIRGMGAIGKFMPLVALNLNISNLALCGAPFLAGFYSKDLILEVVLASNLNLVFFFFFFFSTGLTVSYTVRMLYFSMWGSVSFSAVSGFIDSDYVMIKSMMVMSMISVCGGSMLSWAMFSFPLSVNLFGVKKLVIMMVLTVGVFVGSGVSWVSSVGINYFFLKMNLFMGTMWFMPVLSVYSVGVLGLRSSNLLLKIIDYGWSEKFGGQSGHMYLFNFSSLNYYFQLNSFKISVFSFFFFFYMVVFTLLY
uniref:NADH dehydrogenase subunit 5 n=1 Tax=Parapsyche elsis TaxID=177890 RepID=UPI002238B2B5|nr:NADH dehydrogenase subunit 5 [Parapsyche elsis]UYO79351.1 NADH dehydrogenase subunit 5 [Parapsyche elsis]